MSAQVLPAQKLNKHSNRKQFLLSMMANKARQENEQRQ